MKPWHVGIWRLLLTLLALTTCGWAGAANYVLPGTPPPNCSGSGGNYTCTGSSLGYGDTITVNAPKPATITFTGGLDTNTVQINAAGNAADLTVIVQGTLTLGYQAQINGHVIADSVVDVNGAVRIGGSLTALTGTIQLGHRTRVEGHVRSVAGAIVTGTEVVIGGHVLSNTGGVTLRDKSQVGGGVTTGGTVTIDDGAVVSGAISAQGGTVLLDYGARVSSVTTTSGAITVRGTVVASACVRSADAAAIALEWAAKVAGVCCGAGCGSACVTNGTGSAMPPTCDTGIVQVGSTSGHNASSGSNTLTLTRPTGVAAGDLMLAWVTQATSSLPLGSTVSTVPSGWTLVLTRDDGSNFGSALYRKVAGSSEPANHGWVFSQNGRAAGGIVAFRGVDAANPIEASGSQLNGASSTYTAPSVTPSGTNRMIVSLFAAANGNDLLGAPGGFALGLAPLSTGGIGGVAASGAFALQAASGATGTKTISGNRSQASIGATVALRPAGTALTLPLYLRGKGVPSAALQTSAPTASTLPNFDSGRDSFAGLLLHKGGSGAAETDDKKYQRWLSDTSGITLSGPLQLAMWSAMKDFDKSKRGVLTAYLRECNATGDGCKQFATATLSRSPWSGGSSTWVERTLSFGSVSHTIAAGNTLELKLIVGSSSDDDMWLAYDTTAYASALSSGKASIDHYELALATSSLACSPSTVTVSACLDASVPCTNPATTLAGATATLSTNAGTLGSTTVTFDAKGQASTTLSHPTAANGATATVTLSGESAAAANARQCCAGASCKAANSCTTTFNTAGFIIAAANGGAATTVPTQTAGTASGSFVLRAVRSSDTSMACAPALQGATSVDWSVTCNDPATCSSGNRMTVTGASGVAVAGNPHAGGNASTSVTMNFDAAGNAPFSFNYADVGRVTLVASKAAGGALLTALSGSSNPFVVKPASFGITNIRCTTYAPGSCATAAIPSPGNNPGATSAGGSAFIAAGSPFRATVTALTSGGTAAPNYGRESQPEGVTLTASLVQPAGGTVGVLSNGTIAGGSFSSGVATTTTLAYSEVGIVTLSSAVADGNYLGAGDVSGTPSGNVGRFIPARFALSGASITPRAALGCSPASSFGYLGENFSAAFTLTAQAANGSVTQNYAGAFAKLDPAVASAYQLAGRDGSTVFSGGSGRLWLGSASGSFVSGRATIALTAAATRASAPDGPFNAAFGIAPTDSDGVALGSYDLATTSPFTAPDRGSVGTVALRHGRLVIGNAAGAADRPLGLAAAVQHWNGSFFTDNTLDSCTVVPLTAVNFGNLRRTLTTADTALVGNPAIRFVAGRGRLLLAAPGGGRSGSVDVALSLGSAAADASCMQPWTPGAGDAATAGANLAYLRGAWCGTAYDDDPSARASFAWPHGQDALVYRREHY